MMNLRPRFRKDAPAPPPQAARSRTSRILRAATRTEGAQLLEFALSLPFLLVFLVGIIQFGSAFNLKQNMANAAREGARIVISNSLTDNSCSSSTPCSIQAAANAVANYMTNVGRNSSCISPGSPTSSGNLTWTYACTSGISLTLNRGYTYSSPGGSLVTGTQVTVTYPYTWSFNDVIKLLVPGSSARFPSTLTETAVMQNIAN